MQDRIVTPGRLTVMMPVVPTPVVPTLANREGLLAYYEKVITEINSYDKTVERVSNLVELSQLTHEVGRQLVHNILVKKGNNYIMNKSGTRLKPLAQNIFAKGMQRLASNESPESIVRDIEAQLLLIKGT